MFSSPQLPGAQILMVCFLSQLILFYLAVIVILTTGIGISKVDLDEWIFEFDPKKNIYIRHTYTSHVLYMNVSCCCTTLTVPGHVDMGDIK